MRKGPSVSGCAAATSPSLRDRKGRFQPGDDAPSLCRYRRPDRPGVALTFESLCRGQSFGSDRKLTAMDRRRQIYEGKAKILYEGPAPGTLTQHF